MDELPVIRELLPKALQWVYEYVLTISTLTQLGWLVLSMMAGTAMARMANPFFARLDEESSGKWINLPVRAVRAVLIPLFSLIFMMLYPVIADPLELGIALSRLFENLLGAWVVIRFLSAFIRYPALAFWVAVTIWSLAALNTLDLLDDAIRQLDAIGFMLGNTRISLLVIVKGGVTFAAVLWGAALLIRISEQRIQQLHRLTPSLRVLIAKMIRIAFFFFAIMVALNSLGIDLTSLAVFSGAIGVGIGFGLQKVVSNFISGIILLIDQSIKPGDVIKVENSYGWVNKLSARHVSVITRDGKEHLIPNELLIAERVENWSYSNRNVRLHIPVGIAYHCDPRLALKLMLEAADETARILKSPKPNALVTGFGDSAINLELRAWIDDPANGIGNVTSDLLLLIWDKFHANQIEFPYPQHDIHIKSGTLSA